MLEVKRTLVKSGPELWAEIADPAALARHLSPFGSVRITRAEPERLVEWEGECARGTVRLEPSGFGTRVVLTARTRPAAEPAAAPDREPETEPQPEPAIAGPVRRGVWSRIFRRRAEAAPGVHPEAVAPEPPPEAEAEPLIPDAQAVAVLTETLDVLGTAHHRPFSRA